MNIKILETFVFDGKEHPYSIFGHWGCAYTLCQHEQKVRPGERCHKIQTGEDVDLVHLDCFDEMVKKLKEHNELFPGRG
jgi:hypothetical protein